MLFKIILIFISIPFIELWILLKVGSLFGVWPTIFLVIVTGFIGAMLAKSQGLLLLYQIKEKLARGEFPTDDLFQGFFILLGGILLLAPGLLTDTLGFLFLFPSSRHWFKIRIKGYLEEAVKNGDIYIWRRF